MVSTRLASLPLSRPVRCGVKEHLECCTLINLDDENVYPLFESLERLDKRLSDGREFIMGSKLTEVDLRLYPTIVRFDAAYFTLFRCNIKMIRYGYPYLHTWLLHLYYDFPEIFKGTTFLEQLKKGYASTRLGITPAGPIPLIMERQAAL
jgi:putative glutathione S-transferase